MLSVNILIYDKEVLFAGLLQNLIEENSEFNLAGVANTEEQFNGLLQNQEVNVVMLVQTDFRVDMTEQIAKIKKKFPATKIILLGNIVEQVYIKSCLNAGVNAYISKFVDYAELIEVVRVVIADGCYLCKKSMEALAHIPIKETTDGCGLGSKLTLREKEVFKLITIGTSNPNIAKTLNLSIRTIETHRRNILQKYGERSFVTMLTNIMNQNKINIMELI